MFNPFRFNNNVATDEQIIDLEIQEFNSSEERQWMIIGQNYYEVENDIKDRIFMRNTSEGEILDTTKANNKLAHAYMTNLIDEKVAYLLGNEYTFEGEEGAINKVKDALGKNFQYTLNRLGVQASNKGKAWLHPYINEEGKFNTLVIPSEQCIPVWTDNSHTELSAMIRVYVVQVYEGIRLKEETKVEYYTPDEVRYYTYNGRSLIYDIDVNEEGGPVAHYKKGDENKSWGKVPFVCFKNNPIEFPDVRFIKSLIDNYDKSRSDVGNFIEDLRNLIYVLKGYGGQDLKEFIDDLKYYGAISIDDKEGGVDTLNPTMDITAAKEHFEQLKRDINEFGQGVNKDLDKFGSAPSGVALKFLYSGLDLKCNKLETEFRMAFENLLYFVNVYLAENSQGTIEDVSIIFNRDIQINETETINNCVASKDVISDETIVANHPWVKDKDEEMKRLAEQQKKKVEEQKNMFNAYNDYPISNNLNNQV
jgi:SPP1 family phage portal protein